jgi:hypothetical protein
MILWIEIRISTPARYLTQEREWVLDSAYRFGKQYRKWWVDKGASSIEKRDPKRYEKWDEVKMCAWKAGLHDVYEQ